MCTISVLGVVATRAHAQVIAGTSVYVRQDTDKTTVVAPRWHVGAPVADRSRVDLVYTADVWTSASIDIRTSASKPTRPVTEQRDEINTTATQEWDDLSLSGTYRYSHEYDYQSHGGTLSGSYAMAEKSTTLDFRLGATFDAVGRAGDHNFNKDVRNLNLRVGLTQLIDANTFVQGIYEIMDSNGFNSSAYRYVGFGSTNGLCKWTDLNSKTYCVPERNPNDRLKHAFALNARRALGESFSVGVGYRFYLDSWAVTSHTGTIELGWLASTDLLIAVRYRFYMQGAAKHYKKRFEFSDVDNMPAFSNDKELSAFMSHRVALDVEKEVELDERGHKLALVISVAPSLFLYSNYAPLSQITAIEATLATVLKL
ncbi:MAG TPA: DUF3570 domain-containing protein [Polyangiales bacterium]|nr:DUF3570 domain-containing protein [Polyangiales bacterium]